MLKFDFQGGIVLTTQIIFLNDGMKIELARSVNTASTTTSVSCYIGMILTSRYDKLVKQPYLSRLANDSMG